MQCVLPKLDKLITWSRMFLKQIIVKEEKKEVMFQIAGEYISTAKKEHVKSLGMWYLGILTC